jgi:hypothetical protein
MPVKNKNTKTTLIGGNPKVKGKVTFLAVTAIAGAVVVGAQAMNPPGSSAATGYSSTIYNLAASDYSTAIRSTNDTPVTIYVRPGTTYNKRCDHTWNTTSPNQFYVHSGKDVRLEGNFIVGNGITEKYYYTGTGWHTFPKRVVECDADVKVYEYPNK